MTDVSIGATPNLQFIATTVGDAAPHSMSEMYGVRFSSGNSPTSGTISLSDFRNKTISPIWSDATKIQASDKGASDLFGGRVCTSSDGNTVVSAAYGESAAYVFTRSGTTWSQQAKLTGIVGANAASISSDGNTLIVGARLDDTGATDAGAAFIFTRSGTTWSQQAKIQASNRQASHWFGTSCSMTPDGNMVIVGEDEEPISGAGAAYIFTRSGTTWSQQAKIQASGTTQAFGSSVSISGNKSTAMVGARYEGSTLTGAVYIFTRSGTTWSQQAKIQASVSIDYHTFGKSCSISYDGNTAIVGAPGGYNAGAAYIFTRSGTTWSQRTKIQAGNANSSFGESVFISSDGNMVIIGATNTHNDFVYFSGAAYIYTGSGSTWSQKKKLVASDIGSNDNFGFSVCISLDGRTAIVGAPNEDTGGSNAGAAYTYKQLYFV